MIHKIGNVKDIGKLTDISANEKAVIHKFANILTSMYGSDRDIDKDYGGYILFATHGTTNEEIKTVFDYEANLVEYTELHEGNICASIYITSTEFGIVLITHLDDAPEIIRQSIVKQSYKVRINENLSRIIDVEAISMQEALKQVMDKYKNSEIILNSDDFTDVYFEEV